MDVSKAQCALESVCGGLSQAVERLTAHGLERGAEGMYALEFAQSFAELAGSLECVRRNLAEVWAGLEANAPELKNVVAGS